MTRYKSTTTGKAALRPQDFKCPNCWQIYNGYAGEKVQCPNCIEMFDDAYVKFVPYVEPIFSPKNNGQRWREND